MVFRVSILVVASLAAYAVYPVSSKRLKKQHIFISAEEGEETEVVNGKKNMENESEKLEPDREWELGNREIEHSQNVMKDLEKRRVTLEGKLLELYAQKEKLSHIAFLQRNLDGKTAEIDKLNFTVFALKAEMRDLQEITRQGNLAATQLEKAKKMMEEKQLKNGNGSQIKGQIVVLEEQLSGFTAEEPSPRDALVKKRLETIKNIELQRVQMRRRNKELELEKRELLVKLYAAHAKISALSDMTQSKTVAKISELRHANGDLSKEVERLQKSRFDMVEELVYQRWLNTCLRAEIQYHQASPSKTLQKEFQKASDQKPRKISIQYSDLNSNSSYTSSTDSEDIDSSTIGSSSSSQGSISKNSSPDKSSIGSPLERTGTIRGFSTSMAPSNTSISMLSTKLDGTSSKKNLPVLMDFTETKETPNLGKVRRVSFNDAVETVQPTKIALSKSDGVADDKEIAALVSGNRSRMKSALQAQSALAGEKHEFPSSICVPNENEMDTLIKPPVFAFFLFLFVLLLCFLYLSARIY